MTIKKKCLAASVLLSIAACAQADTRTAEFSNDQCVRKILIDQDTGNEIVGAEDIALSADGASLFVSAYHRRAAERAAKRRADHVPSGGLYRINVADIVDEKKSSLVVQSLLRPLDVTGGLRPHGIHWDDETGELLFINRAYLQKGRGWQMSPRLERVGGNGEPIIGEPVFVSCAANDVFTDDGEAITTFTHSNCGWSAGVENLFRIKKSGLRAQNGDVLYDKALFANGAIKIGADRIMLAATREQALILLADNDNGLEEIRRIELSGAPDNLSLKGANNIVAAVHPALGRLTLNRKLGIGKSPSRVIEADIITGAQHLLFDDPTGKVFSAASVGVSMENSLIVGSATDRGLLVCNK